MFDFNQAKTSKIDIRILFCLWQLDENPGLNISQTTLKAFQEYKFCLRIDLYDSKKMLATKPVILVSEGNHLFSCQNCSEKKDSSTSKVTKEKMESDVTTYRIIRPTEPLISCHGCLSCHSIREQVFMKLSVWLRGRNQTKDQNKW